MKTALGDIEIVSRLGALTEEVPGRPVPAG